MYRRKMAVEQLSLSAKVEDAMIREVIVIDSEATVRQAVDSMNKYGIGCLVVLDKGKVDGIVTERDILKRVIGKSRDAEETKIKEIMSQPVWVVDPNTDLESALQNMLRHKIKKLPVVLEKEDRLVGLLTLTDIARFQPKILSRCKELLVKGKTQRESRK